MQEKILLAHGGGGLLTSQLIHSQIQKRFSNDALNAMDDSAVLQLPQTRIAFTTDSYVVSPVFFPGGNIGDLAVCGTVNDLSMSGATPLYLSLSLILEEGFAMADLERVLDAIQIRAKEAGVSIVCGDTKVVPKGQGDGIYINTAGVGVLPEGIHISSANAKPGDRLIVSGTLGLHGLAVMLARNDFQMETPVKSDVAPLNKVVSALLDNNIAIHTLRDITRGGLSMALHDIADGSDSTIEIEEKDIPFSLAQTSACDILGLDPLHIPCEGRMLAVIAAEDADRAINVMQDISVSGEAAIIGTICEKSRYSIELITSIGTRRILTPPRGEELPRIC